MKQLFTWVISALLFAAIGGFCVWTFMEAGEKGDKEELEEGAKPKLTATATSTAPAEPPAISRDKTGAVVVRLETEVQERVGLKIAPLEAATDDPETVAYGTVQEDPTQVFSLRAPLPGTVVADKSGHWAGLGESIAARRVIGAIIPRLGPAEQADMASKLAAARAEEQIARALLDALRISLESKRKLTAGQEKIVSEQVLQEAQAKVKGEEARLQGALDTVRVLEAYVTTATRPADALPLTVSQAGRVVEVLVQPGESVEAGQALIKLASHDRLLARVSLPAGRSLAKTGLTRIVVANDENHPFPADEVIPAATADPATGGQMFVFAFRPQGASVQPAMPATAHIKIPGEPAKGVVVPQDAIIRYAGAGWVYVKDSEETFVRREVPLTRLLAQGWFVPGGVLSSDDKVVVQAAQSLLSQELKHAGGGGEEE